MNQYPINIRSISGLNMILNFKPLKYTIFNIIEQHSFSIKGLIFFQYRILRGRYPVITPGRVARGLQSSLLFLFMNHSARISTSRCNVGAHTDKFIGSFEYNSYSWTVPLAPCSGNRCCNKLSQ